METEEHNPGRIGWCSDSDCNCWLGGLTMTYGQLRSCELKFELVVNLLACR